MQFKFHCHSWCHFSSIASIEKSIKAESITKNKVTDQREWLSETRACISTQNAQS